MSRPLRILHVVPTYFPATRYGGPIYSVHGLCKALALLGHDVHVYTTNVDGAGVSDVPLGVPVKMDGVDVTYFPTGLGRRLYRSPAMAAMLRETLVGFDVVHLHSVFLWPTSAVAAMARRLGVPYVLAPRGMLVLELIEKKSRALKRAWIALFERRNIAGADAVHVTAAIEEVEIMRMGFKPKGVALIANGVDIAPSVRSKPGEEPQSEQPKGVVLFLGRLNWKKGLDRLIPALQEVPNAQLIIAGNDDENYQPQLEALIAQYGLTERARFVGPVYGDAKQALLASADVFALTSYSENFGMAVLEAMAAGLPVVVTPEVGLASVVTETGCGLVVDGDIKAIAHGVSQLLGDPVRRRTMGDAGAVAARERFTWQASAIKAETLYRDILRDRRTEQTS